MICNNCYSNIPEGTRFCPSCGNELVEQAAAEASASAPAANSLEEAFQDEEVYAAVNAPGADPTYTAASVASAMQAEQAAQAAQQTPPQANPWEQQGQHAQYQQQPYQQPYQAQQPYQQQQYQQQPYQQPYYTAPVYGAKSKVAAGLLAIFLGSLGVHKFYLGYNKEGGIMLAVTLLGGLLSFGIAAAVMGIIGIVEGVVYLTKTDQDFYYTYEANQKTWF